MLLSITQANLKPREDAGDKKSGYVATDPFTDALHTGNALSGIKLNRYLLTYLHLNLALDIRRIHLEDSDNEEDDDDDDDDESEWDL